MKDCLCYFVMLFAIMFFGEVERFGVIGSLLFSTFFVGVPGLFFGYIFYKLEKKIDKQ